jgi:hypothetical protein
MVAIISYCMNYSLSYRRLLNHLFVERRSLRARGTSRASGASSTSRASSTGRAWGAFSTGRAWGAFSTGRAWGAFNHIGRTTSTIVCHLEKKIVQFVFIDTNVAHLSADFFFDSFHVYIHKRKIIFIHNDLHRTHPSEWDWSTYPEIYGSLSW